MQETSRRHTRAWAVYDWANSAYNLVITSTMFPAYYEEVTRSPDGSGIVTFLGMRFVNTALYNYALAFAFLVVAISSPILSSIADLKGNKKQFLRFFCTLGAVACSGMYYFDASSLGWGITCLVTACIGFWSSFVFYNSYLPEIAAEADRDRVSAQGFTMGYIGSVILQLICFAFLFRPEWFGWLGVKDAGTALRTSFAMVGLWWYGFAQIPLRRLPEGSPGTRLPSRSWLSSGFHELGKVWQELRHHKVLRRFLAAFFFYNMGVQTVMLAATLYGKSELAIPVDNLIIAILLIQIVAIFGAQFLSWLSVRIGNIIVLMLAVAFWIGLCVAGYQVPKGDVQAFYLLAAMVGFVMGGIQSVSRSTYAKFMPVTRDTTSWFSFYDVTEKVAIVIGMFSFGAITEWMGGSQRQSVLALAIFFIIGLLLLVRTWQAVRKNA
ncbi:MAG: MFS transporter [Bacteroidetes bacterium]|nr:MFS transporter [Bacteroidota bacterium]